MIGISDIYNVNTAVDINLLCVAINFLLSLNVVCMQVSHPLQSHYDLTAKKQISLHGWATGIPKPQISNTFNNSEKPWHKPYHIIIPAIHIHVFPNL